MGKEIAAKPMNKDDARAFVNSIKTRIGDVREMLVELHDRQGWEALEYGSWEACVAKEFPDLSKRHADRQVLAGRIQKVIKSAARKPTANAVGPIGPKHLPPVVAESHLRPLTSLPEDQQVSAYMDARDEAAKAGKTLTAKDVKAKADLYKADNESYVPPEDEVEEEESEPEWDPAVAKKAKTALGQLVRALDSLGVDWGKMTLQQVKNAVEK